MARREILRSPAPPKSTPASPASQSPSPAIAGPRNPTFVLSALGNQAAQRLFAGGGPKVGPDDPPEFQAHGPAGEPLSLPLRRAAEASLGRPMDSVRIHHGLGARNITAGSNAEALTWRNDIFVRPDRWAPDTAAGRTLLGHELVHAAQNAAFGPGTARQWSERGDSAEREAERLAPQVLGGVPGSARPASAPQAMIGRQQAGGDAPATTPAPQASTAPSTTPTSTATTSSSDASSPAPRSEPAGVASIDPSRINVPTLTNGEMIRRDAEAADILARANTTTPETEGWRQLRREIREERTRRVAKGFIFLSEQTDSTPAALYQMRAGSAPGTIEIVTADTRVALGSADVTLTGGIMSQRQVRAYIGTLGYRVITGAQADATIANRGDIMRRAIEVERQRNASLPIVPGVGRTPLLDYSLAGGFGAYGPGRGQGLPMQLGGGNFRGRVGELSVRGGSGWGTGLQDYNTRPWMDVTGVNRTGNFPVVDFGPGRGIVPRILDIQPISVTTSDAATYTERSQQYTNKIEALLDVPGRRATAPSGTNMVLQHLQQASGDSHLAAGTPAYQQAMARYLPDTMFAVPDANVAALRTTIANPNAAPPGGGHRLIARSGGFRSLYTEALRTSPIQLTLRNGTTVTCNSLAELAARAPSASSFSVEGSTLSFPPEQRISTVEFNRAMGVLGNTAASRIVSQSTAPAMAAAVDAARVPAGGPTITHPTRILEIDSNNLSYVGERIGRGMAAPHGPASAGSEAIRWTTAAHADPVLSAVRAMTNNPFLQRGTPEFEAARSQALGNAMLAINADDVAAFRQTLSSDTAWEGRLRGSFGAAMADNPVTIGNRTFRSPAELDAARSTMTTEEYNRARAQAQGLVSRRVSSSGVTTAELGRLENFRDRATTALGDQAHTVTQADVLSHVRLGSTRATAESFGRGGLGGMIIGVVTTAGTMYIDEREHPDWAVELAVAGGRDFAVSGTQSAIESRLTYYMAQRAISTGTPLTGLARFGLRAGPTAIFAGVMEGYNITEEKRTHSTVEVASRLGRAMGIAIVAMEIGALAGSVVPGAGTAAGAVVGFLVGAIAGGITAYVLDSALPGGAEEWNAAAAAEEARRARAAEAEREANAPKVVATFGGTTNLTPTMSSPDINPEEQAAIAQWATLLTISRRTPPPSSGGPGPN